MGLLQQSTARNIVFLMVQSADHVSALTGATVTVTLSKNGGAFAAAGGAVTEISSGWYSIALNTTDTNTLGDLALHCTATSGDPTDFKEQVVAFNPGDSVRLGLTALPNAAAGANGGLPTGNASGQVTMVSTATGAITAASFAAGAIDASAIATDAIGSAELAASAVTEIQTGLATSAALATVQADTDDIQTRLPAALVGGRMDASVGAMAANVLTASAIATDAITAAKIAADAIGASELAADAVTEIAAGVSVGAAPTAAQNAAAVWDLAISGHTTSGTFGNKVNGLSSGGAGGPVGSGSSAYTVTVTRPDGVTPIEGAAVWVSTDQAGTNVVAGTLYTDTLGRINSGTGFLLDPGAYWLWRQHSSWTFATNPTAITVT